MVKFLKSMAIVLVPLALIAYFYNHIEQGHNPSAPTSSSTSTSESKSRTRSRHITTVSTSTPKSSSEQYLRTSRRKCEQGTFVSGTYSVRHNETNLRVGPGIDQALVINRKASDILGETEYRTLWKSMVLEGKCETDKWLKVKIVKADGRTVNWEDGWVQKEYVTGEPSDNTEARLFWDIDSESNFSLAEKQLVKRGALRVLDDEENCAQIITGYRSGSRKGAYYVTCNARNGEPMFNVWFTPDEVTSGRKISVPRAYPEKESRLACHQAIRDSLTYPSTLDIHNILGYATEVHNNGNRTIIQDFSAKTGLGIEVEYKARCLILPGGNVEITIDMQ